MNYSASQYPAIDLHWLQYSSRYRAIASHLSTNLLQMHQNLAEQNIILTTKLPTERCCAATQRTQQKRSSQHTNIYR